MRDYKPGTQLTGDARTEACQQAADLYGQGATIRSYGGTRVLLLEAGVQLRGRGGRLRKAAV